MTNIRGSQTGFLFFLCSHLAIDMWMLTNHSNYLSLHSNATRSRIYLYYKLNSVD